MEELLMGKDHSVATQQSLHASSNGRLLFAHKLNIYLTSVQETQLRLYDELERVLPLSCTGLLPMHCKWSKRKTLITSSRLNMSRNIMT